MLAFVETPEDERGKGDGPEAVVDFFERDGLIGECDGDEERRPPGDVPILIDPPNLGMPGILEWLQPSRHGARRGLIMLRRDGLLQAFMRPVVVVLGAEAAEAPLLARAFEAGGARCPL